MPADKYDIWAEVPDWLNDGVNEVAAEAGKTATCTDLKLVKGTTVRVRLIDAETHKPIALPADSMATIFNQSVPLKPTLRLANFPLPNGKPDAEGKFEIQVTPGRKMIHGSIHSGQSGQASQWISPQGIEITVTDGKVTDVDLPVIDASKARGTLGTYLPAAKADLRIQPSKGKREVERSNQVAR